MNILIAVGAFLKGLWAGIKAERSAKAGGELVDGKTQVDAVGKDVADIEAEIAKSQVNK